MIYSTIIFTDSYNIQFLRMIKIFKKVCHNTYIKKGPKTFKTSASLNSHAHMAMASHFSRQYERGFTGLSHGLSLGPLTSPAEVQNTVRQKIDLTAGASPVSQDTRDTYKNTCVTYSYCEILSAIRGLLKSYTSNLSNLTNKNLKKGARPIT